MESSILPFYTNYLGQWSKYKMIDIITGIEFNCAEQYMMFQKAVLFNDIEIGNLILNSSNPRTQKDLGRQVRNFDSIEWNKYVRDIVYNGNYLKFTQNKIIYDKLILTKDKLLVEASPWDLIWGVGLKEDDERIYNKSNWKGKNWLGEVLSKLRDDLIEGKATYYSFNFLDRGNFRFK
jgi:ribA/ribD-fused uncharacterized protein